MTNPTEPASADFLEIIPSQQGMSWKGFQGISYASLLNSYFVTQRLSRTVLYGTIRLDIVLRRREPTPGE